MEYSKLVLSYCAIALLYYGCGSDKKSESQEPATGSDSGSDAGAVKDASQSVKQCTEDRECSDGLFCNGQERCMPGTAGADEMGCVPASSGPCEKEENCDEKLRECLPCAGNADIDGDNHDALACGGNDCDDNDRHRFPGNPEVCDEEHHDEDCNPDTFGFRDLDNDGAADEKCCNRNEQGKLLCGTDCDDTTFTVHPDQLEICDGKDNDCDDETDEETNEVPWYLDNDNDNYGVETDDAPLSCAPLEGHTIKKDDCDDDDASRHPAQIDLCDQVDNDCNGKTDEDVGCDIEMSEEVGTEGGDIGQVVNANNVLGLKIPEEALTEEVEIGIKQVEMPSELPETAEAVGPTYEFTPHGLTFGRPVELHLPFVAADTEDLALMRRQADDDSPWERLQGVSFRNSVASVELTSLSYFQVVRVIEGQVGIDGGAEADAGVMDGGEPVCGNGVVEGDEQCDDENDDDDDGCTRKCKYSCDDDGDCDDGNPCNGEEICDEHVCDDSDPNLDDGESCGSGKACSDGECEKLCGNGAVDSGEECDDGDNDDDNGCTRDCQYTCKDNADCDDGNPCNGEEICDKHVCDDSDPDLDDGESCGESKECLDGECVDVPVETPCSYACVSASICTMAGGLVHIDMTCDNSNYVCCQPVTPTGGSGGSGGEGGTVSECENDQYEPDNNSDSATTLVPGEPQTHLVSEGCDDDWMKFSIAETTGVMVEVETPQNSDEIDFAVYLRDSSNNTIDSSDCNGSKECHLIVAAQLDPGEYFIRIREYDAETEYSISLMVDPHLCVIDEEEYEGTYRISDATDIAKIGHCRVIAGDLSIDSEDILINLDGLSNLQQVTGNLSMYNNSSLVNLNGLSNLTEVGGLSISGNGALTDLSGLGNVARINGRLYLYNNANLTSLNGLTSLESIAGSLEIRNHNRLSSLAGISNLKSVGEYIQIQNNAQLTTLNGLESINTVSKLYVYWNANLQNINGLSGIETITCSYEDYEEEFGVEISSNGILEDLSGLNNLTQINCGISINSNAALSSLNGLDSLESIQGDLIIEDNGELEDLFGMDALAVVGGDLTISGNTTMLDLSGLNDLQSVGGNLLVSTNVMLNNLAGLAGLQSVFGDLDIRGNDALASLNGLSNLSTIGANLTIYQNDILGNLHGLDSVDSVGTNLIIMENAALATCEAERLRDTIGVGNVGGTVTISGNNDSGTCD